MNGYINGYNFNEMNAMKYYAPPATWSDEKKRDNVRSKIFSGDWWGAEKKDGYFTKIVKDEDGNIFLCSRSRNVNGEYVDKKLWVPQIRPFLDSLPNGTCVLGELYFPSAPGSKNVTTIMQCLLDKALARQEKGEKLHLYIFDCVAYNGKSYLNEKAFSRILAVDDLARSVSFNKYVSFAHYFRGQELWNMLQKILGEGGEGIVILHNDGKYEPDKRSAKNTLKVKKELEQTIDCFFTGHTGAPTRLYTGKEIENWQYWEDIKTREKINDKLYRDYMNGRAIEPVTKGYFNGWAGSLEIGVFKGKEIIPIGYLSGLSDEIKANVQEYTMKPIEVTAMELDNESGALRHGKMKQFRPDLRLEDCTWDKIFK